MTTLRTIGTWGSLLASTILAAGAMVAPPSIAAEPEKAAWAMDEIVVTSRKREERLQEVPDSVVVLTSQQLEVSNVNGLRDFVNLTPNLFVRDTFRSNESFLTMRGISSAQGALPPVAFVVDGVQYGSNDFINQDLIDVERIEVLRGPQGALYGQGAIAGAINIVTKDPTNDFEGFGKVSYGRGDTLRVAGALSGPIVEDQLYARVTGYYKYSNGLIHNNYLDKKVDGIDQWSGRGQLYYKGESLKIRLQGGYTRGTGSCCFLDKAPHDGNFNYNFIDANGNYVSVDDVTNPGTMTNIEGKTWDRLSNLSLKIDYDFDGVTVTSISGYNHVYQHAYADADYTSASAVVQDLTFKTNVYNQELRFTSNSDGAFHWMFGGYYQKRKENQHILVGNEPADPYDMDSLVPNILNSDLHIRSKLWALFATADYDITDKLTFTVAGRYDHDAQDSVDSINPLATAKSATFKKFQPKAVVSYDWNDSIMTYISYAQGFRPGGYTVTGQFDNEVTKNYEIGFKSTLLDGMLTLNGAAYHIDYYNQQISFVDMNSTPPIRGVINVARSRVDGMELELAANPSEKLQVSAGLGVSDSVALEIDPNPPLVPVAAVNSIIGNKSPLVPSFTFNLAATWTEPVGDNLDLVIHGNYRREGSFYHTLNNVIKSGAHNYINGKVALESDSGWSVGVYGKNLLGSRVALYVSPTFTGNRMPNQPASYGVEASFKF